MSLAVEVPKASKSGGCKPAHNQTTTRAREQNLRSESEQPKRHVCAVLLVAASAQSFQKRWEQASTKQTTTRAREQNLRSKSEQPKRHVCAVLLVAASAQSFQNRWEQASTKQTTTRAREQNLRSKSEQPKRHVCAVLLVAASAQTIVTEKRILLSFGRNQKKEPRRLEAKARTQHRGNELTHQSPPRS